MKKLLVLSLALSLSVTSCFAWSWWGKKDSAKNSASGENVETHFYLAKDTGLVTRYIDPKDKEETVWIGIDEVEDKLSYENLKELWKNIKNEIKKQ